jgi:serine/threonine kinase 3
LNSLVSSKGHDTNPDKPKYRPLFLKHFDDKEAEAASYNNNNNNDNDSNGHEDSVEETPQHDEPIEQFQQQPQQPQPQQQHQQPVITNVPVPQSPQSQVPPPSAPGLQTLLESQQNEDRQR